MKTKLIIVFLIAIILTLVIFIMPSVEYCGFSSACSDYNGVNNFFKELNEANNTKNIEKLKKLRLQARACMHDIYIAKEINNQIEIYESKNENN